jgi:hypothetical protein
MRTFARLALIVGLVTSNACGSSSNGGNSSKDGGAQPDGAGQAPDRGAPADVPVGADVVSVDRAATPDMAATMGTDARDAGTLDVGTDASLTAGFVRGTVSEAAGDAGMGEVVEFRALVASGVGSGILQVGANKELAPTDKWIINATAVLGMQSCNDAKFPFTGVGFTRRENNVLVTYASTNVKAGAACSIDITQLPANAGDLAKGTFSAVLVDMSNANRVIRVTAGAFEAPRM